MGKIRPTYSLETKQEAIELYLQGKNPYAISDAMGIGRSIIQRWVQHYEREGMAGLEEKRGRSNGATKGCPRKYPPTIEQELIRLKAENAYLKKLWELQRGEKKK